MQDEESKLEPLPYFEPPVCMETGSGERQLCEHLNRVIYFLNNVLVGRPKRTPEGKLIWDDNHRLVRHEPQISQVVGTVKWAKVSEGFENGPGDVMHEVPARECNCLGEEVGEEIILCTPLRPNKDTALFVDYVVGYVPVRVERETINIIITDCFDDPMGTIRALGLVGKNFPRIPDGWEELAATAGRFLVGCEENTIWETPENTGGTALGRLTQGLQDHPLTDLPCFAYGIEFQCHQRIDEPVNVFGPLNHVLLGDDPPNPSSLAPPWFSVIWIKRTH